jgi:hypothetical protein
MELTAALLAAQREGDSGRHVLVINAAWRRVLNPVELRDTQFDTASLFCRLREASCVFPSTGAVRLASVCYLWSRPDRRRNRQAKPGRTVPERRTDGETDQRFWGESDA